MTFVVYRHPNARKGVGFPTWEAAVAVAVELVYRDHEFGVVIREEVG